KQLRDEIAPHTLLTINGDIPDYQTGLELVEKYGVDGVMIGRGVFTNPFAFEKEPRTHTSEELIELFKLHLDLHDKYSNELEPLLFRPLRRFIKIYIRGFPVAGELRNQLMKTESTDEVREILNQVESEIEVRVTNEVNKTDRTKIDIIRSVDD